MKELIILFYNTMWGAEFSIPKNEIPTNCVITTDRNMLPHADAVVFHLPDLPCVMAEEVDKYEGQIWVAWNLECEENHPWIKDEEIRSFFDLWMGYHQEDDIKYPYYSFLSQSDFECSPLKHSRQNRACMFISSPVNNSGRREYLKELMKHTEIDSFGRFLHNKDLPVDEGEKTLLEVVSQYKFTIAFENAVGHDYVTEKFYNPLLAGSVPIYLGAPNINNFIPGKNCFVDVSAFHSPAELGQFINQCYEDENLFHRFEEWREYPLLPQFVRMLDEVKENPIIRLCKKICELKEKKEHESSTAFHRHPRV